MPENTSGLATTMVSFAAGGTAKIKTTILITVEEAKEAMKKASGLRLAQPKGYLNKTGTIRSSITQLTNIRKFWRAQMKSLTSVFCLILILMSLNNSAKAQEAQGNVFVVTNLERAFPDDGTDSEFDSLSTILLNKTFGSDNEYVVSSRILRHWWGHNNRDFIQIVEVKSWEDVAKANQKSNELFEKAWSTKEARDAFNNAYNKYFTGKHSDEIYREVTFNE